jgi:hypothetical protein
MKARPRVTDPELLAAQRAREDLLLDRVIDNRLEMLFSLATAAVPHPGVSQASTVGPKARHQLRFLLRYYAKKEHPFTACVHDNMKRFGPGRTEAVCATLKDVIRGTTHWRGHPELDHGAPGAIAASDDPPPVISEEVADYLCSLPESTLELLFSDARETLGGAA